MQNPSSETIVSCLACTNVRLEKLEQEPAELYEDEVWRMALHGRDMLFFDPARGGIRATVQKIRQTLLHRGLPSSYRSEPKRSAATCTAKIFRAIAL